MDLPAPGRPAPTPGDAPGHGHTHTHGHAHGPHDGAGSAESLELDASVFAGLLDEAVAVAVGHAPAPTRAVVDLGAGTGTGTRALARAFPDAEIVAVDADAAMLDRSRARLAGTGLADRVRTVEADLDAGWPPVGVADVVWASASSHHVADPARVSHDARDALAPGGSLVVVEMTATSPVSPDDADHADLTARLERAMAHAGWNRYPDWTPYSTDAGSEVVDRREPTAVVPPGPETSRWAHATASRQREHSADRSEPADLAALDAVLAATAPGTTDHTNAPYDVAIVGGGPAGSSAAVTLARSSRSVVVLDAGEPRNAPAQGAHNSLGREGVPPRESSATGRAEAEGYGAEVRDARVARADGDAGSGFTLTLDDGGTVCARRVSLATGLVDESPDVPGVREGWGSSVSHCPFCHGWEVRGQRIAVLATGPAAAHQVSSFRQLTPHVTSFQHTAPEPDDATWEQLSALGVRVVEGEVARLDVDGRSVRAVVLADGTSFPVEAVVVGPRFVARGESFEQLGGTSEDHPAGRFVPADPRGATAVPGVWAAGNSSDLMAQVGASAAAGVMAGAGIHGELAQADAAAAVARRRTPFAAHAEP
ncbi:hypothetical protein OY671_003585, partial [Metschnikowia pulcherrima]